MKRYQQFEPVVIEDFEARKWRHPEHRHNHYEFIYIKHGTGVHVIDEQEVAYGAGDLFLLGPEEGHYFRISDTTRFVYLKFTDLYIHQSGDQTQKGVQHLEYLIKSRETHTAGFALTEGDRYIVDMLFNVLIALKGESLRNEQVIWMQVLSLAAILQRNMPELRPVGQRSKDMQAVFCYIHKNIYRPDLLKAAVMAANFNISEEYLGPFFKRNTGLTLREYIGEYRYRLIKHRAESGKYSLKQIAAEFGLTDESHVSKLLHKKVG